jgi:hypothetical protein
LCKNSCRRGGKGGALGLQVAMKLPKRTAVS